eukprot:15371776-Alexandrium_andersonii.AAC.1
MGRRPASRRRGRATRPRGGRKGWGRKRPVATPLTWRALPGRAQGGRGGRPGAEWRCCRCGPYFGSG